ncbi:hypothetical protein PanWU01x14_161570 [Parasponia andersonii]|uniref:Uncharacterized protein n=1 Tax=Parasponia andersonii TaxID=3476 RepID=A0A2P5CDC4_PARAD|nr:hypothetical protein PanWU01x14_161570 [Parasponia andersonii]
MILFMFDFLFFPPDVLLEKYFADGTFSELEHQKIGRPKKSLIHFSGALLVLVTIVMHILVNASESELSTPSQDPMSQALIQNYANFDNSP